MPLNPKRESSHTGRQRFNHAPAHDRRRIAHQARPPHHQEHQLVIATCQKERFLVPASRMMALFRHPIRQRWLDELAQEAQLSEIGSTINHLLSANLLRWRDELSEFERLELHPQVRAHLLTLLSPDERQTWHSAAAKRYHSQENYLEATYHYRQLGTPDGYECAAQTSMKASNSPNNWGKNATSTTFKH